MTDKVSKYETKSIAVLKALRKGPTSIDLVMADTGLDETQTRSAIRYLRDCGLLVLRVGRRRFALVEAAGAPYRALHERAQASLA